MRPRRKIKFGLCLLFLLMATNVCAATYYLSPDGSARGDGSRDHPWSVEFGLLKGGHNEYIFRPGFYHGPISINKTQAGSLEFPTVLRSELRWQAKIVGAQWHAINIDEKAPFIIIDSFEIWGADVSGIKSSSDNTTIRNCWVHNNNLMGISIHGRQNSVIENNLIEYNGMDHQFHHGVYLDGNGHIIIGNVIRHNAGYGLHLYPKIFDTVIINNLIYGHASKPGVVLFSSADVSDCRLKFINNTVADNVAGMSLYGCNKAVIQNNIFAGSKVTFQVTDSKDLLIDYNLYSEIRQVHGVHDIQGDPGFVNSDKGIYLIHESSAAREHGNPDVAPMIDLTGQPRSGKNNPDLGAFQYIKIPYCD